MNFDIIMYHYVRPIKESRYPKINGLELDGFERQLEYFLKEKVVISTIDVVNAALGVSELQKDAVWLTFDDGYKDHFEFVAPILERQGIDAAFFPVSDCFENEKILDVNKIHYILASVENDENIINFLSEEMRSEGLDKSDFKRLWHSIDKSSNYDTEEVIFFKRMLQRDLPIDLRKKILTNMFKKIVGRSEDEVARELYMNKEDLISLHERGFCIGSHTTSHMWLNSLSFEEQEREIERSLEALHSVRGNLNNWIMCYPYGGYNKDTLSILEKTNCALGLTTKVGSANFFTQNRFELRRLVTNDFPQ